MKKTLLNPVLKSLLFFGLSVSLNQQAQAQVTQTLSFTGTVQTFVVPPCVSTITLELYGAQGASQTPGGTGGLGGYAKGVIPVTTGQVLNIYVGGQNGYNGGGTGGINGNTTFGGPSSGNAGVGGGASDIRIGGTALSNRVMVAGGGGGAAHNGVWTSCQTAGPAGNGGAGGGLTGGNGTTGSSGACNCAGTGGNGGAGGTQTGGGASGTYNGVTCLQTWAVGNAGVLGIGGSGSLTYHNGTGGGGGGGGGYYGGGSGANGSDTTPGGGGGGGSSYVGSATSTVVTSGVQAGDGVVYLRYNFNGAGVLASASSLSICAGATTTLSGSNVLSYTWTPGGSNASSISVNPAVSTTYTLQGTNSLGCISTAVLNVTVDAGLPVLSVTASTNNVCQNKPVTFTASGATTYTWTGAAVNGVPFIPPSTADYTVTGANACGTSSAVASVTVNPGPPVTASINNPTVCSGNSIILNGGGSSNGYTWTPNVPNNAAFIPAATTNYTVTGVAANGCTATAVTGVTVLVVPNAPPVVTPTAICFGSTATLSATGATGYTWNPGTNPNTASITVSPPGPTTYTLLRTNGACATTATINLIVNPLPLVNASASPSQICVGTGVNLLVVGPITNTWLPGGFTASNFTLYPNFSQNYTVTGSNGNCTATAVVPVVVNPTPTLSILTPTTTICAGNSLTLTAGGAQTYTWLPSTGTNSVEVISPPTTTIITLSGTNSFSCTTSKTQLIVVNPLPNMNLGSSLPYVCAGQTAVLSITNVSPNVVYNWNASPVNTTAISVNPVVTTSYFATGTNTLTGCVNTNTIALSVYISTFTAISGTAICKGETVTLTASGAAPNYSWTGGIQSPSLAVSPQVTTTYYVTGINVSCQNTMAITVTVNPLPNVTASVAKSQICKFEVATITGNGASTYSWNTGATTQVLTFTLGITTTYTLTGTDNNGCSKTVTATQFVATCIGVDEQESDVIGIKVYPNPNNGEFSIEMENKKQCVIEITDLTGRILHEQVVEGGKASITVQHFSNGVYYLRMKDKSPGKVYKIVKD